jgi:hypothetical protein
MICCSSEHFGKDRQCTTAVAAGGASHTCSTFIHGTRRAMSGAKLDQASVPNEKHLGRHVSAVAKRSGSIEIEFGRYRGLKI